MLSPDSSNTTDWIVPGLLLADESDQQMDVLVRAIIEHETLDLTSLYTVRDLSAGSAGQADLKTLMYALFFAISEGGLCLRVNEASSLEAVLLRLAPGLVDAGERSARIIKYISSREFEEHPMVAPLGRDSEDFRPLIYEREAGFLYYQKHFAYKRTVARAVDAFFASPVVAGSLAQSESPAALSLRTSLHEILEKRPVRGPDGQGLRMAIGQQLAILLGLIGSGEEIVKSVDAAKTGDRGGFLIITGGPGTGKTSTVLNLLRALVRQGVSPANIGLAAPTGRAARRLTETLQTGLERIAEPAPEDLALNALHGVTLHRLLRFQSGRNRFAHDRTNPLDLEVLVVDEVSMVDVALMANLLEALDVSRTRVIFLGDRDQLPSVEAGAVLADFLRLLAPEDQSPEYSSEIIKIAREMLPGFADQAAVVDPFEVALDSITDKTPKSIRLTNRIVQLTESFRSGDAILTAASVVNAGQVDAVQNTKIFPVLDRIDKNREKGSTRWNWPGSGCFRINVLADELESTREAVILDWIREHFDGKYLKLVHAASRAGPGTADDTEKDNRADANEDALAEIIQKIFSHINRSRILAVNRRGRSGVTGVNQVAGRWFQRRLTRVFAGSVRSVTNIRAVGSSGRGQATYFPGMPVLIVRNDHRRELYNGDVGVILLIRAKNGLALRGFFERPGGRFVSYPIETLPEHEAAFALTIHKSQGSEYNRVLILLPDDPEHRLLSREVLYTGLTRAKDLAIIFGLNSALETAVREKLLRETGGLYESNPA